MIPVEEAARQTKKALARFKPNIEFVLIPMKLASSPRATWVFRCKAKGENWSIVCKAGLQNEGGRSAIRNQMHRLKTARKEMADPRFQVPEPYWFYPNLCVLVMEDAKGTTLSKRLVDETAQMANVLGDLEKAGRWIGLYQSATAKDVLYDPTPHMNWVRRAIQEHENGTRLIPEYDAFSQAFSELEQMASKASGLPARRCVTHRDCHLDNILFRGNGITYGIDIENRKEDDALRDVFHYFFDFALKWPLAWSHASQLSPAKAAILEGYDDKITDPYVFDFFQTFMAVNMWSNIGKVGLFDRKKAHRLMCVKTLTECCSWE